MEHETEKPETKRYKNLGTDESLIRQLMERVAEAVQLRNMEIILAAYDDDAIIFDVRDDLQINKEGLRKNWQECFDSSIDFSYKIQNLHITTEARSATAFYLLHTNATANSGRDVSIWLRVTTAFAKKNKKWTIVHEHISAPGDFVTGKIMQDLYPELPH